MIKKTVIIILAVLLVTAPMTVICNAGQIVERPAGDVDGNAVFEEGDSVRLGRFFGNWDVEIDEKYSDVNCDGVIDELDAVAIGRVLAGWDVVLYRRYMTPDEVMEYLNVPSAPGQQLSFYTYNYDMKAEGSEVSIIVLTGISESTTRIVYEYVSNEKDYEDFVSENYGSWLRWKKFDDCPGLVQVDYSEGYSFNPNTEYPQLANNPDNHVYYGTK